MRKVIYFDSVWNDMTKRMERRLVGEALFHQFGVSYDEFEGGPGNFTSAVIELDDGTVRNIGIELIRFIDRKKHKVEPESDVCAEESGLGC